jgi:nucleotide-binding universal stress UspA family protein
VPVLVVPRRRRTSTVAPFSHVAAAVDFGPDSNRVVERALRLARKPTDRVTLLHVVPGFSPLVPRELYDYGLARYREQMVGDAGRRLKLAVPAKHHTPAAIYGRVLQGEAVAEISRAVDRIHADVLVVGVPKRGVLARALFGTTAARLLRRSRIPVLAVPEYSTGTVHQATSLPLAA